MRDVKIDEDYLLEIAGEETGMVISIVKDFKLDAERLLAKLMALVREDVDLAGVAALLHKWKGSAGSLGMISLNEAIVSMEDWGKLEWSSYAAWDELQGHLAGSVDAALIVLEG